MADQLDTNIQMNDSRVQSNIIKIKINLRSQAHLTTIVESLFFLIHA